MSQRVLLMIVADFLVIIGLLFILAGTIGWVAGWIFVALLQHFPAGSPYVGQERSRALERAVGSSPIQRNQPLWDKMLLPVLMLLFIAWLVLMPLDNVRFDWSDVPVWLQVLGALGIVLSFYGMYLVYLVVKLQEKRGQSVVTTDPYRYVRHPMYASSLMIFPATALLLGSWLRLLLSPVLVALIILSTAFEDRMLRDGLAGYAGYAQPVRCRLIPRVW